MKNCLDRFFEIDNFLRFSVSFYGVFSIGLHGTLLPLVGCDNCRRSRSCHLGGLANGLATIHCVTGSIMPPRVVTHNRSHLGINHDYCVIPAVGEAAFIASRGYSLTSALEGRGRLLFSKF